MSKIIIENKSMCSDCLAMDLVSKVMADGFVSGEKQYCWVTVFKEPDARVCSRKTRGNTHSFVVT